MASRFWRRLIQRLALALCASTGAAILSGCRQSDPGANATLPDPLVIEARGREREWQFTYAGADGLIGSADDVVTRRQFQVPAEVEVILQLRSDDYIYVFSCPDLVMKEIAVPDLEYEIRFRAGEAGTHELAMDPMCGFRLPPGATMGNLTVSSETDFRSWFARLAASE